MKPIEILGINTLGDLKVKTKITALAVASAMSISAFASIDSIVWCGDELRVAADPPVSRIEFLCVRKYHYSDDRIEDFSLGVPGEQFVKVRPPDDDVRLMTVCIIERTNRTAHQFRDHRAIERSEDGWNYGQVRIPYKPVEFTSPEDGRINIDVDGRSVNLRFVIPCTGTVYRLECSSDLNTWSDASDVTRDPCKFYRMKEVAK